MHNLSHAYQYSYKLRLTTHDLKTNALHDFVIQNRLKLREIGNSGCNDRLTTITIAQGQEHAINKKRISPVINKYNDTNLLHLNRCTFMVNIKLGRMQIRPFGSSSGYLRIPCLPGFQIVWEEITQSWEKIINQYYFCTLQKVISPTHNFCRYLCYINILNMSRKWRSRVKA